MMANDSQISGRLLTLRDVANRLNARQHRVKYAIEAYSIEPRQRAGIIRLWGESDLPQIHAALNRTAGRVRGAL